MLNSALVTLFFALITTQVFAVTNASGKTDAKSKSTAVSNKSVKSTTQLETYKDLIQKAQNLTLQRDRLQASQVLIRGLQRESKGSLAYKELAHALDELSAVFYTEKAQTFFVAGEALLLTHPKDAIGPFQEALKIEDGNVAVLNAIARTNLINGDCSRAESSIQSAEALNPTSSEVRLLRMQKEKCAKNFTTLTALLGSPENSDIDPSEVDLRGLQIDDLIRRKEIKKAKAALATWETKAPEYPEVYYWKWEISRLNSSPDRQSAQKYVQLCQNLTPRKRKSYILDVDLCKGRDLVETFLKETSQPASPTTAGDSQDE